MLIKTEHIKNPEKFDRILNRACCHRIPTTTPGINALEVMQRNQGLMNDSRHLCRTCVEVAVNRGHVSPEALTPNTNEPKRCRP